MSATAALESLLVALVLGLGALVWRLRDTVGGLTENMRKMVRSEVERATAPVQGDLRDVARQVVGLTRAVVPLVAQHYAQRPADLAAMLSDFNGTWSGVSHWESERLNPLTQEELERFEGYRVKFFERHVPLTQEEVTDFSAMLDKMQRDQARPPDLAALFVLAAILGAVAALRITRPEG